MLLATVATRIDLRRVRRVVDVGCGKGHLLAALRAHLGVPALGLDIDGGEHTAGARSAAACSATACCAAACAR